MIYSRKKRKDGADRPRICLDVMDSDLVLVRSQKSF